MPIFLEVTSILTLATIIAFVMKWLKQPLIVGYILTGILVGPFGFQLMHSSETLELFSELGITMLLFIIGIHLSPKVIKELGSKSFLVSLLQIIFTFILTFVISIFLGIDKVASIYVALALTLSSTIIILKLISDKNDTHKLYAKLTISLLIIQDIVATFALLLISSFSETIETTGKDPVTLMFLKVFTLIFGFSLTIKYLLPKLTKFASNNPELLFLFSLTWGLGTAIIFSLLGLSIEVGALVAGVALSSSEYSEEISSRLLPLRDFFVVIFFIFLGSNMILNISPHSLVPILVLSLFVLIIKPLILFIIMNLVGYHKKVAYMSGISISQVSEFSLILVTLGLNVGHLDKEVVTTVTFIALLTISGSSYLILYAQKLYKILKKPLSFFELKKNNHKLQQRRTNFNVVLFGFNRAGSDLLNTFKEMNYKTAVVDYDPNTTKRLPKNFRHFFFGNANNLKFLESFPLNKAQLVISTLPSKEANLLLIKTIKKNKMKAVVIVYAHTKKEALQYYDADTDYVILPHHIGVKHTANLIKKTGINTKSFQRRRKLHLKELRR